LKKIVFTGPESTGKSTLATQLSQELNCPIVEEYSRTFLQKLNRDYDFEDITQIAKGQVAKEDATLFNNNIIVCDTDLLVCKIWQEFRFGRVDPWLEHEFKNRRYNIVFLCNVDIPWVYDPLRENPSDREELFNLYKSTLDAYKIDYTIVQGSFQDRYQIVKDTLKYFGF
jgi:NadR type nicotinamide-nucleotide adenylyltransferase